MIERVWKIRIPGRQLHTCTRGNGMGLSTRVPVSVSVFAGVRVHKGGQHVVRVN